jgi:catechol-2,3-dioxygenase
MPRPARFSHVVINTYDLDRLVAWYKYAFDLDVTAESPRAVIATYDEEHHRFAFTQAAGEKPADNGFNPLKHVAYGYNTLGDLMAQYRHMKEGGYMPVESVNHGPTMSFYYKDPDGNGVEFFVDRFSNMNDAKAFMASEPFKKNLFGYYFDAEKALAQYERGVPDEEIWRYDQEEADRFLEKMKQAAPASIADKIDA